MKLNDKLVSLGKSWVQWYFSKTDSLLKHHGVKGQKWGVKNGPPYPIKRSGNSMIVKSSVRDVIDRALKSGEIKLTINREKQLRHTKSYHTKGRSYINGDLDYAQELVHELSGTGEIIIDKNGNWNHRELVDAKRIIGTCELDYESMDKTMKNESPEEGVETELATIVYSKTGTHIYPRKGMK